MCIPVSLIASMRAGLRRLVPVVEATSASSLSADRQLISVVQFNILASQLASPDHFPYVQPSLLQWDRRRQTLLAEMKCLNPHPTTSTTSHSSTPSTTLTTSSTPLSSSSLSSTTTPVIGHDMPDVLCLEELSNYWDFFGSEMRDLGYESVFVKRPSIHKSSWSGVDKFDGCGIFYRRSRFRLVTEKSINFKDIHDRCGLLVLLEQHQPQPPTKGRYILVSNTHLYWDSKKVEDQMSELKEMEQAISEMRAMVRDKLEHTAELPIIFCGDLNNGPSSPIYDYLAHSFLNQQSSTSTNSITSSSPSSSASSDSKKIKGPLRSAYDIYKLIGVRKDDASSSNAIDSEAGGAESEPELTTLTHNRSWTIDYIWYSTSTLRVTHLLEIPERSALQSDDGPSGWADKLNEKLLKKAKEEEEKEKEKGQEKEKEKEKIPEKKKVELYDVADNGAKHRGIPNSVHGSDHLPILAVFEIV